MDDENVDTPEELLRWAREDEEYDPYEMFDKDGE